MKPKKQHMYMLTDDMKDRAADAQYVANFIIKMGREWSHHRSRFYRTMPLALLRMLDEIGDVMVCEEKGCRDVVHGDWDFCKKHGMPKLSAKVKKAYERKFPKLKYSPPVPARDLRGFSKAKSLIAAMDAAKKKAPAP